MLVPLLVLPLPLCAIGKPSIHLPVPLWVPLVPLWVALVPLCATEKPSTHFLVPLLVLAGSTLGVTGQFEFQT